MNIRMKVLENIALNKMKALGVELRSQAGVENFLSKEEIEFKEGEVSAFDSKALSPETDWEIESTLMKKMDGEYDVVKFPIPKMKSEEQEFSMPDTLFKDCTGKVTMLEAKKMTSTSLRALKENLNKKGFKKRESMEPNLQNNNMEIWVDVGDGIKGLQNAEDYILQLNRWSQQGGDLSNKIMVDDKTIIRTNSNVFEFKVFKSGEVFQWKLRN